MQELKEHDAETRLFAELFFLEDGVIPHIVAELLLVEWCAAHPDDARALSYYAEVRGDRLLMEKASWKHRCRGRSLVFSDNGATAR